jgi:protein-tyrosine-phosphatase
MSETRRHYLFVCAANLNRSPTAEDVFRKMAAAKGLAVEVSSAGILWCEFSSRSLRSLRKSDSDAQAGCP